MKRHLANALDFLANWVRSLGKENRSEVPVLLPLTPRYDSSKHGVYFDVIQAALDDLEKRVLNIALTGSYGVGKSSILTEVATRYSKDVIAVSLSTLGFPDDEPILSESIAREASTKTNRIQKEIVKQLLYSQDPLKTPGSRYHRTTRFRFWRAVRLAVLLAVPMAVLFLLTGWTDTIAALIPLEPSIPWLPHLIVFMSLIALLLGFLAAFHNRFQIEKLGTGAATISLSARSATYFDEYLDEIVYFFEMIKRDIVIFEDIDRFDEAHIFETLRSLNSILNGAKQLKGRKIRFIYAIKDSIFDELGTRAAKEEFAGGVDGLATGSKPRNHEHDAAEVEVARANRTKFFDLVIPVVPFITHRSARDLLVQTMNQDLSHNVSDELVDLTARHVADMRLIKNIRNEYVIFKRQVIDLGNLQLSENSLFAMVLYKSTHLSDFELIKLGRSKLDLLYRDGRALVAANQGRLRRIARDALLTPRSIGALHASSLGDALDAHVARTLALVGASRITSYGLDGDEFTSDYLRSQEFWERLVASGSQFHVTYRDPQVGSRQADFSHEHLEAELGAELNSAIWVDLERARLDQVAAKANTDRDFLSHADMSDLITRDDFTIEVEGKTFTFRALAEKHLGSELAIRLLEAGFIDRNFTLYTSTFYTDRVSANATNYILKNVDPAITDLYFSLTAPEVEAVLRERGRSILREKSAYNISILDYVLEKDPAGEATLLDNLVKAGPPERELMLAYLDDGKNRESFVRALTPRWSRIFEFLITDLQIDEDLRKSLVDAALQSTDTQVDYATDLEIRDYLLGTYRELDAFMSTNTEEVTASEVARLAYQAGVEIPVLADLSPAVQSAIVRVGAYVVDRDNLLVAIGDVAHPLSLDAIAETNDDVYARVLADLPAYAVALGDTQPTIGQPAAFISTIGDVLNAGAEHLPMVILKAAPGCTVNALSDVSSRSWETLAEGRRFPITFANVKDYVDEFGLDDRLARMLNSVESIEIEDGADDTDREGLALAIIGSSARIRSAEHRAKLVASLELDHYIASTSIPAESGELIGWLLDEQVIKDDAAAIAAVKVGDWEGLAFAIGKSTTFSGFMTTAQVTPENVGWMVNHPLVSTEVKDAIIARFSEFTVGATRVNLQFIAKYVASTGKALTFDETARLARAGVDAATVVVLLTEHLNSVTMAELAPVLLSLGGEYAKLSVRNGKRPRLARTPANRALVDRLSQLGNVSSVTESDGEIRVYMRQP